MRIDTRIQSAPESKPLRRFARDRATASLARVARHVAGVLVQVRDLNGPRGGVDQSCRVLATINPGVHIAVEERRANPYAAVDAALDRVAYLVRERVRRRHKTRRRPK